MVAGVLIFAEVTNGALASVAKEVLGIGRKLADALGEPLMAAVLGHGVQSVAQEAIVWYGWSAAASATYTVSAPWAMASCATLCTRVLAPPP
jgi:electron transfer flavoprotein alpha subunit